MKSLQLSAVCGLFLLQSAFLSAQQTVGLFTNTPQAHNGYTLFAPMGSTTTYLIDNCGEMVQSWPSTYRPALSTYLLENGILLRTGNTDNLDFDAGGSGGIVEMIDWNGNVIWDYTVSSTTQCQHHDVEYLPNGNILMIIWDSKTQAEATQAGRESFGSAVWSEKIIEIQPDLVGGSGTIVWEWSAWDHLVQDYDNTKDNFGVVADSPELIDINYTTGNLTNEDWLHFNAVEYNAELDQIAISTRSGCEIWIIDHSTTTAEAAGHTGGNSGKGGDLLYRWGNPQAYDQGTSNDQKLYYQHDVQWIPSGYPNTGKLTVYNNRAGEPQDYSEVNMIDPPVDGNGNYLYSGGAYAPTNFFWTYQAPTATDFFSPAISGAHSLPNGNVLICEGQNGRLFEVDDSGNTVWEYINPVTSSGPVVQGTTISQNSVFRCTRYDVDYAGLNGQDLTPQGYIESGSTISCDLYSTASLVESAIDEDVQLYPNPVQNELHIETTQGVVSVNIHSSLGKPVFHSNSNEQFTTISTKNFANSVYYVQLELSNGSYLNKKIVVNK